MSNSKSSNAAASIMTGQLPGEVALAVGGDWNDIINRYEEPIRTAIFNTAEMAHNVQLTVKMAGGIDIPEYDARMAGMLRMLREYDTEYHNLVARRDGRTGRTKDSNDYTLYVALAALCTSLLEEMGLTIQNELLNLTEFHQMALDKLAIINAEKEAAEAAAAAGEAPAETPVAAEQDSAAAPTNEEGKNV